MLNQPLAHLLDRFHLSIAFVAPGQQLNYPNHKRQQAAIAALGLFGTDFLK
ncbi:hypothetical protein D3C75_915680 [compost metagenome]